MKEDIEMLEKIIKQAKEYSIYSILGDEEIQAIENLIKENIRIAHYANMAELNNSKFKDKIKEKINKLEIELKDEKYTHDMYEGTIKYNEYLELVAKHNILEELLEEV